MDDIQQQADARFQSALADSGARDPRDYYRDRLKDLKTANPEAYSTAVEYYRDTLIPSIAAGDADPLAAWRAYGLRIAKLTAEGRTMEIDPSGKARPYSESADSNSLILHLPELNQVRALLVGLPPTPSRAQMAAYDWLVGGRKKLRS